MMGSNDWVGILALAMAVKVKREGCSGQLSLKDSDVPLCFLLYQLSLLPHVCGYTSQTGRVNQVT